MARKKKGLPFVVQPRLEPIMERVGTEESGIIEIRRQGYLSVAEKTMEQATSDMSDASDLIDVVREIAVSEGRSVSEIFEELQSTDAASPLLEKYATQIATASGSAQNQQRKVQIVAATALILCRIDAEWTVEQSMELHPDLLEGLYQLYQDEDARSLAAFESSSPSKEGESKK